MKKDISESREISPAAGARLVEAIRANQSATDIFDETLAAFLGINRTDGRCLDVIERRGRISAGALANETGLTTGAVTAVIDRLEAAGYVKRTRDSLDRRKVWVEPTESIRALTSHIFGFYQKLLPQMLQRFTPEQLAAVTAILELGSALNLEFAAALREHLDPNATSADQRLAQARRFEKALGANESRLMAVVDSLMADVGAAPGDGTAPPAAHQSRGTGKP